MLPKAGCDGLADLVRAPITPCSRARNTARAVCSPCKHPDCFLRGHQTSSEAFLSSFGVMPEGSVCLLAGSGTPWKSRIVRDRAALARLLPPESRQGDDPRSPPRRGSSHLPEKRSPKPSVSEFSRPQSASLDLLGHCSLPASNPASRSFVTQRDQSSEMGLRARLSTGFIHRFRQGAGGRSPRCSTVIVRTL